MTDKTGADRVSDASPPVGISRRDALTGAAAAVGFVAAPIVEAATTASRKTVDTNIPQIGRGYFSSNGNMFIPRGQGFDATRAEFYEVPLEDPEYLEVWCYTDKISYSPGEEVQFHTSTTAQELSIEILRDGQAPSSVHAVRGLRGAVHKLPPDFYENGCGWPVNYRWRIPEDMPSGFYVVISRVSSEQKSEFTTVVSGISQPKVREQEHGFFVLRNNNRPKADILFLASTCTWTAYNDWGGFSHYVGYNLPDGFQHAPRLSSQRPFARGFIWSPEGSPRKPHRLPIVPGSIPLYPVIDFAYTHGYSKWFTNAGWATYERPFAIFAESNGFRMDYATQLDLHYKPDVLEGYKCVVIVGHSEYWTWEMREAIDRFVEQGGNVARFAGDFSWQIRLEDDGRTQVAYKDRAKDRDPIRNTDQSRRLTGHWEDPAIDWFGAETFGLNNFYGIYAHVGVHVPRGTGGFTVYRPEHWAFKGTDLYYGDDFGGDAKIFGYEVDGLDYTFRDGLPFPTFKDRAQPSTEILAMALASNTEADHGHRGSVFYYGDDSEDIARFRYREVSDETRKAAARANGMIVTFQHGAGTVFHAGSCEWVAGLKFKDYYTETITRNVLSRFVAKS
jgi:hypothetical protein